MKLYSRHLVWNVPTKEREVFITFDDGPSEHTTDQILEYLKQYDAKASFFCVGKNVQFNPKLFQKIIDDGHLIGNHTYDHNNGWQTSKKRYVNSVYRCESIFGTDYFRPPFGKMTIPQIWALKNRFKIVMWSLLSGDFDVNADPDELLQDLKKSVKSGDIIVFHDSAKAKNNVLSILPRFLAFLEENGYKCSTLRPAKKKFIWF